MKIIHIRQLPNGKWSHRYSQIEWTERCGAETDFRFTVAFDKATYQNWTCPIGLKDCTENCGNYGCGN